LVMPVADPDLDAGVPQIEGRAAPQMAIAQHGHLLGGQRAGQSIAPPIDPDVPLAWSGHRMGKVPRPTGSVIALSHSWRAGPSRPLPAGPGLAQGRFWQRRQGHQILGGPGPVYPWG